MTAPERLPFGRDIANYSREYWSPAYADYSHWWSRRLAEHAGPSLPQWQEVIAARDALFALRDACGAYAGPIPYELWVELGEAHARDKRARGNLLRAYSALPWATQQAARRAVATPRLVDETPQQRAARLAELGLERFA